MTIGVLNPVKSTEMTAVSNRRDVTADCSNTVSLVLGQTNNDGYNSSRVNRCLFGPVNREEMAKYLQNELDALCESQKRRWDFDFRKETPVIPPENYVWEKIGQCEEDAGVDFTATVPAKVTTVNDHLLPATNVFEERISNGCSKNCTKYRQTTINEYWRCTKRSSECQLQRGNKDFTEEMEIAAGAELRNGQISVMKMSPCDLSGQEMTVNGGIEETGKCRQNNDKRNRNIDDSKNCNLNDDGAPNKRFCKMTCV